MPDTNLTLPYNRLCPRISHGVDLNCFLRALSVSVVKNSCRNPKDLLIWTPGSGENLIDQIAVDVGQAKVTALKFEGQEFMVDSETVKDSGL